LTFAIETDLRKIAQWQTEKVTSYGCFYIQTDTVTSCTQKQGKFTWLGIQAWIYGSHLEQKLGFYHFYRYFGKK
jgi:hypothetical protein